MVLLDSLERLRSTFWSERVWLPPNTTWKTYQDTSQVHYAQFNHLYYGLPTALALLLIRFILERTIYEPIGLWLGIKLRKSRLTGTGSASSPPLSASLQAELETLFQQTKRRPNGVEHNKLVDGLVKRNDNLNERQVERWLRRRQMQEKPSTMQRFCESCFRITFYSGSFFFGLYVLWDKPWLTDSVHCYKNYPHHDVSNLEFWYYNIELGFYLALIVSQFFDVKRKDFWQMFIHHLVTVSLLVFSWASNLVRVGSLVLIIHDFADIPLEGAKLARYTKSETASNIIFAAFTFCWIFSRIGLLPARVLAYSLYWALDEVEMFPAYYIFNALLVCLQVLHIVWTWLILRIAYNAIYSDGVKDLRESDESAADEGDDTTGEASELEDGVDEGNGGGGDNLSGSQVTRRLVSSSNSASNGNNNRDGSGSGVTPTD